MYGCWVFFIKDVHIFYFRAESFRVQRSKHCFSNCSVSGLSCEATMNSVSRRCGLPVHSSVLYNMDSFCYVIIYIAVPIHCMIVTAGTLLQIARYNNVQMSAELFLPHVWGHEDTHPPMWPCCNGLCFSSALWLTSQQHTHERDIPSYAHHAQCAGMKLPWWFINYCTLPLLNLIWSPRLPWCSRLNMMQMNASDGKSQSVTTHYALMATFVEI